MKKAKEYCEEKYLELLMFNKDMENRKIAAQEKIQKRSEEIQKEIVSKTNKEIQDNMIKQQKKLNIIEQIEKSSMEGNMELVNQLLKNVNNEN